MPPSASHAAARTAVLQDRHEPEAGEAEKDAEEDAEKDVQEETADSTMGAAESSTNGHVPDDKKFEGEQSRQDEENVYVSLTYDALDANAQMARVKSAKAGAVVLFAGCTRDTFQSKAVTHLSYSTYAPLALKTLSRIACSIKKAHNLTAIAITHRLGRVDIGDESILIAIASPHRQAAWQAGEACLEDVKQSAEIWKEEWFQDGGVWRSNRDGKAGVPVRRASEAKPKSNEGERRSSKGKERRVSISPEEAKERLPSRRKSSAAGGPSQIGIKKAATEPPRPKAVKRTTTFYEGGFEI